MKNWGKLRMWILKNGYRITDFANMFGISRQYVFYLMKGKRKPSKKLMADIRWLTSGKVKYLSDILDKEKTPQ